MYDVTCAYVDMFGDGPTSGQSTCTVKTVIDESMIADEAISSAKLDKIVQTNISNATANANTALQNSNNALVNANAALSNSNITADKLKKIIVQPRRRKHLLLHVLLTVWAITVPQSRQPT